MKLPSKNLSLIDNTSEAEVIRRYGSEFIISPICPDYNFKKIQLKDRSERVHDFNGIGENMGIVYEKLIRESEGLFKLLDKQKIKYQNLLLVADVEGKDKIILKKLGVTRTEFNQKCQRTVEKINLDLKKKGFKKSRCLLMSQFFKDQKYSFFQNIQKIHEHLLKITDKEILKLILEAQNKRCPLYEFWFGMDKERGKVRTLHEMAMYTSFGYCPAIGKGVILCADSEILSRCYNLFKKNKTPVIYISGKY